MLDSRSSLHTKIVFYRFVIASTILIVNVALFGLNRTPIYFLIASIYFFTIIYLFFILFRVYNISLLYAQVVIDLISEALLIHYTGGIDSVLVLLFPLSSIAASILISPRAAVLVALVGSSFYAGIITLEFFNVLPLPFGAGALFLRDSSYVFTLLYFRVTIFCIIGFLSAYIAEQIKSRDRQVLSLQQQLRREDRLLAIGRLAANTAHEIRNPLASISGCVEALQGSVKLDANNQRLFDLILKESARLNNIINGLLEYVNPKNFRFHNALLSDVLDEGVLLVENNKDLTKKFLIKREDDFAKLKVICDEQKMLQVFFNLLLNAVEAVTDEGVIVIGGRADMDRQTVQIEISDNGRGMSPEQLEHVFEPFTSGKDKGVGLGLSIALSIMKEHGGDILAESSLGKGSVFKVILPLKTNLK
ncbi:MAG: hypothetical protein KKB82_07900 [Candidatus Omnitrophica bacterium]|nr:hypothetical protein [Candidatus Omnitrophota bacterium]MBU1925826.1 hypothetical protein [Candidatus Omnitrophota bacterium]